MDRKTKQLIGSVHLDLFLQVYLLGRQIGSLVKEQNSDRMSDVAVLAILRRRPVSVGLLGRILAIKASAMSEKVRQLEDRGYVEQVEGRDGRKKMVGLTELGQERVETLLEKIQEKCRLCNCRRRLLRAEAETALNILNKISL